MIGDPVSGKELASVMPRGKPVTPDEADQILERLLASHFNKSDREHARISIPANPERDDDLRMSQFIEQHRETARQLDLLTTEREEHNEILNDYRRELADAKAALVREVTAHEEAARTRDAWKAQCARLIEALESAALVFDLIAAGHEPMVRAATAARVARMAVVLPEAV